MASHFNFKAFGKCSDEATAVAYNLEHRPPCPNGVVYVTPPTDVSWGQCEEVGSSSSSSSPPPTTTTITTTTTTKLSANIEPPTTASIPSPRPSKFEQNIIISGDACMLGSGNGEWELQGYTLDGRPWYKTDIKTINGLGFNSG